MWNIKVMVIPIVIDALGTVTKGLVQVQEDLEIRGWVETNQTTALLRSIRIQRCVLETCRHWTSSEKPSANAGMKNLKRSKSSKFICKKIAGLVIHCRLKLNPDFLLLIHPLYIWLNWVCQQLIKKILSDSKISSICTDLIFLHCDVKPTKIGGIVRYCWVALD